MVLPFSFHFIGSVSTSLDVHQQPTVVCLDLLHVPLDRRRGVFAPFHFFQGIVQQRVAGERTRQRETEREHTESETHREKHRENTERETQRAISTLDFVQDRMRRQPCLPVQYFFGGFVLNVVFPRGVHDDRLFQFVDLLQVGVPDSLGQLPVAEKQ